MEFFGFWRNERILEMPGDHLRLSLPCLSIEGVIIFCRTNDRCNNVLEYEDYQQSYCSSSVSTLSVKLVTRLTVSTIAFVPVRQEHWSARGVLHSRLQWAYLLY